MRKNVVPAAPTVIPAALTVIPAALTVIPAQAGIHTEFPAMTASTPSVSSAWIPAFAGMTT
jgi:hypothetical protein